MSGAKTGLIEIDPSKNRTVQKFMDAFVEDPAVRLELEMLFSEAAHVNPWISPEDLAKLNSFADLYEDPRYVDARSVIRYAANAAVLGILQVWREARGEKR